MGITGDNNVQENNGLVLRTLPEARVGPLGEVLGGLLGTSLLAAIDTETRVCAGIDGDNALGGKAGDGQMCVVAAGKG